MVETSNEFTSDGSAPAATIHGAVVREENRFFEERVAAFCRQLDIREAERYRAPGRSTDFAEVFHPERPLAARILTGVAVVGVAAAGGTGIFLAEREATDAVAPAVAQAIVAPAKAASPPDAGHVDSSPATVTPVTQTLPAPSVQPASLPDPTPPEPPVVEAAREMPTAASMPPALTASEPSTALADERPPDGGWLDREGVVELQQRLNDLGFAAGPLDGVAGPLTTGAIRDYQASVGLQPTGRASGGILRRLRQEASARPMRE